MLLCTVRDCHLPLIREQRRLVCARAHSFDVARSGYVNLLQPQDRRSKDPGDSSEIVAARRRLHERGVTAPLLDAVGEIIRAGSSDVVLEAGCGDGFYVGSLARLIGFEGHGMDISTPAIEKAARRYKACQWIVANADRFVPYADGAFSIVMSIAARMNAAEFRRILRSNGRLLVAVPAPDDLIELRGTGRERVERTVDTFAKEFTLVEQRRATTTAELDEASVRDVLASIYRPMRSEPVRPTRVTFSLDLLLFHCR